MPDCGDSTAPAVAVPGSQTELLQIADELQGLSDCLRRIADTIVTHPGSALATVIRGVAECVCSDLLQDAIETLRAAGRLTEGHARREQNHLAEVATRLTAI